MSKKDFSKAAEGLDKFFSENHVSKAAVDTKPKKTVKKVFSFRAEAETADNWRLWADAAGLKVDELGTKAITEYIKKHPLTEDQNQIYELKKAQKKS